jgi:hypothetical protein
VRSHFDPQLGRQAQEHRCRTPDWEGDYRTRGGGAALAFTRPC